MPKRLESFYTNPQRAVRRALFHGLYIRGRYHYPPDEIAKEITIAEDFVWGDAPIGPKPKLWHVVKRVVEFKGERGVRFQCGGSTVAPVFGLTAPGHLKACGKCLVVVGRTIDAGCCHEHGE